MNIKENIKKEKDKKNEVLSLLDPILKSDIDSLSDLEDFLQKTVQAAATIVSARNSRLVLFKQEDTEDFPSMDKIEKIVNVSEGTDNLINLPLILRGLEHPIGYIEVKDRIDERPFDLRDLVSVMMMGRQATLKIENDLFYRRIYENMIEMLKTLVNIIESRDPYTHCHSSRVTDYALRIAKDLNIPVQERDVMRLASLLHDIGKIGIPDHILSKKGRLTSHERDIIRTHSVIGENIVKHLAFLFQEKVIIRHHHECFDGSGYPDGLKGEEIPLSDRIIAVTDSFDAMTSDRPYRPAKSPRESMEVIESLKGIKYDPDIVQSFKRCLETNRKCNLGY